jgi:uncharacterized protein
MIKFKQFELSDRKIIEQYILNSGCNNCDFSFANLYFFRSFYRLEWAIYEEFLIMRVHLGQYKVPGYMQPLGTGDWIGILPKLMEEAKAAGETLRLFYIGCSSIKELEQSEWNNKLYLFNDRASADYIYDRETLEQLRGSKLQPKRNHVNKFEKSYEFRTEQLAKKHYEEVEIMLDDWVGEKQETATGTIAHERQVVEEAFQHFDELGLIGLMLYANDKPAAFTFGAPINHNTFDVMVEKGETEYEGVFAAVNKYFVQSLPDQFTLINREEDLGLEGLRRSKLSYQPTRILDKWFAIEKDSEEYRIFTGIQKKRPELSDGEISHYLCNEYKK